MMVVSKLHNAPFAAAAGIIGAFLFTVAWIVAASNDPTWIFGQSTLSDMGVSSQEFTASLFNYGCIVTGILIVICSLGKITANDMEQAAGVLLFVAGIFLALVGVFNESYGNLHLTVAWTFFILFYISLLVDAVNDAKNNMKVFAAIGAALLFVVIGACVANTFAFAEAIAVMAAIIWILAQSVKMLVDSVHILQQNKEVAYP